jgi:hypothetical protein
MIKCLPVIACSVMYPPHHHFYASHMSVRYSDRHTGRSWSTNFAPAHLHCQHPRTHISHFKVINQSMSSPFPTQDLPIYTMGLLSEEQKDWLIRQKIKYFHQQGGPRVPSKETNLYFDWRTTRDKPKEDSGNMHPGRRVME